MSVVLPISVEIFPTQSLTASFNSSSVEVLGANHMSLQFNWGTTAANGTILNTTGATIKVQVSEDNINFNDKNEISTYTISATSGAQVILTDTIRERFVRLAVTANSVVSGSIEAFASFQKV